MKFSLIIFILLFSFFASSEIDKQSEEVDKQSEEVDKQSEEVDKQSEEVDKHFSDVNPWGLPWSSDHVVVTKSLSIKEIQNKSLFKNETCELVHSSDEDFSKSSLVLVDKGAKLIAFTGGYTSWGGNWEVHVYFWKPWTTSLLKLTCFFSRADFKYEDIQVSAINEALGSESPIKIIAY